LGGEPQRDHDQLQQAARILLGTRGNYFPYNQAARQTLARILQRWASGIERGTLRPAERTTALQLAQSIVRSDSL
jgi:hypothetical protein